jgi:hypothetical protein
MRGVATVCNTVSPPLGVQHEDRQFSAPLGGKTTGAAQKWK